jgi:histidyl-tRNA synthetase
MSEPSRTAPIQARTLKGFRDFLPADMAPRQQMIRQIEDVFAQHGFGPVATPTLEYAEILTGKYGDEGDKLLYSFDDHGGRRVAMRYDLTVPLARLVAQHGGQLPMPFRRYHIAPVWRADKPQRGRFREFMQCDADLIGSDTAMADAEILAVGLGVLRALGVQAATLRLNHRGLLAALLGHAGVLDERAQLLALRAIDKWDKVGVDGVSRELSAIAGVTEAMVEQLMAVFALDTLDTIEAAIGAHEAIDRLRAVLSLLRAAGLGDQVQVDPRVARGLDYYTGIIYETHLTEPRVASYGAIMSGGRYDGLIGTMSKTDRPAVGISVGLDRLLAALVELGLADDENAQAAVYVTVFDTASEASAMALATRCRAAGHPTLLETDGGRLGKQLKRAAKRGCAVALVEGPDERAKGVVVVRDLRAGEQQEISSAQLEPHLASLLGTERRRD